MSESTITAAFLTREEADTLADAAQILGRIEDEASSAGWRSIDSMSAMRFGKVSEASSVAKWMLNNYLIAAAVSTDDPEASYALERDEDDE